jgi:hypothetical protein
MGSVFVDVIKIRFNFVSYSYQVTQLCNTGVVCNPVNCVMSNPGPFTSCTNVCGGGTQVDVEVGAEIQIEVVEV